MILVNTDISMTHIITIIKEHRLYFKTDKILEPLL